MTSCTVGSVSKCENVTLICISEPKKESCKSRSGRVADQERIQQSRYKEISLSLCICSAAFVFDLLSFFSVHQYLHDTQNHKPFIS